MTEDKYIDLEIEDRSTYIISVGYKHWNSKDPVNYLIWLRDVLIKSIKNLFGIEDYKKKHAREEELWIVKKIEDVDTVLELLVNYILSLVFHLRKEKLKEAKKKLKNKLKDLLKKIKNL